MGPRARPAHPYQGLRHGHGPQWGRRHHWRAVTGCLLRWTGVRFYVFPGCGQFCLPLHCCSL